MGIVIAGGCILGPALSSDITVATYNIDTNIARREEGFARDTHPQWGANERQPLIQHTVNVINERHHPDIWLFQEGRAFTTKFGDRVDSITKLEEHLMQGGYTTIISPYNLSERAFRYISAFNPKRFDLRDTQIRYFTKTPDQPTIHPNEMGMSEEEINKALSEIKANNFGDIWERSAFIMHLYDKTNTQEVWVINVHLTIPYATRIESTKLLNTFTKDILSVKPDAKIIVGGDFNSISEIGGAEMTDIISEAGLLNDATQDMPLYGHFAPYLSTFFTFPYDFGIKLESSLRQSGRLTELEKMEASLR